MGRGARKYKDGRKGVDSVPSSTNDGLDDVSLMIKDRPVCNYDTCTLSRLDLLVTPEIMQCASTPNRLCPKSTA